MPLKRVQGEEPNKLLLRALDVEKWLGIPRQQFHKCVRAGLIPYKQISKGARKLYKKEDIKRIFLDDFRMG